MPSIAVSRYCLALGVAAVAALGVPHATPAATFPGLANADGSVRFDYGRSPMPSLICKPHFVCDITLDAGEKILNMAIGDATHWIIAGGQSGPSGSTPNVFLKPTALGLKTNLVITTTRRVYDIALRSAAYAKYSRIRFSYDDDDAAAKALVADHQRAAIQAVLAGIPRVAEAQADAKYKISGEPALEPEKVFNDGTRTFIKWKILPSELPAVVAIANDGSSQATDFRVVGNSYVIDNVYPSYNLVLGGGPDHHGRGERHSSIRHL